MPASTDTTLGRPARSAPPDPELSGFRLIPSGDAALDTRLQLAASAQRSLDVQCYHIENDDTGRTFLRSLRDAALGGVRVRLLLDDLYAGAQRGRGCCWRLDRHALAWRCGCSTRLPVRGALAGCQTRWCSVRLHEFEPHATGACTTSCSSPTGALAVAGGRNIGGRYFTQTTGENFFDLDTVVAGALLPRLAQLFDR